MVIQLLIVIIAFYLNFQNVISQLALFDKIFLSLWMLVPAFLFVRYIPGLIPRLSRDPLSFLAILFVVILLIHCILQYYIHGITGALYSFVAYGLWLGLYAWCLQVHWKRVVGLAAIVFIASGLLHSYIVIYEYYSENILFKLSSIGSISRYYGISTSLSIMGLQIAVSILVLMHLLFSYKSIYLRALISIFIISMLIALFISTSRGPTIYLLISSLLVLISYIGYTKNKIFFISTTLILTTFVVILIGAYKSGVGNIDFILQALTTSDESNQVRLSIYMEGIRLFLHDVWVLFFGYGSGSLTQIPVHLNNGELTIESSLMKGFLELGLIGMLPFILSLLVILFFLYKRWGDPFVRNKVIYFAVLFLILMQCITHETYKTWIGSLYLTLSFGTCASILLAKRSRKHLVRSNSLE